MFYHLLKKNKSAADENYWFVAAERTRHEHWRSWPLERSEKDQNCKLQFPQPDYWPLHSPDFRTVFGIMTEPFSSCEIGKTWGTNKQVNKQTNKNWNFQFPQPDLERRHSNEQVLFYTFCGEVLPLLRRLNFLRYIKWEKALYKMRKGEKTTFQWPKVSRLLTTLPRHRPDIRTGLRF